MIAIMIRIYFKIFGKLSKKIKHIIRRKLPILTQNTRRFKTYREKHTFTDREIIFYAGGLVFSTIIILCSSLYAGKEFIANNMFRIISLPLLIVLYFEFAQKVSNIRRLDILKARKVKYEKKIDKIFFSYLNEEKDFTNSYDIVMQIEFKVSRYYDYEHEAKLRAIDNNCSAVLNTKISEGYFRGYLAKKIN